MQYRVRFLPADVTVDVSDGTTISDAARLAEITTLHLPCGGRGTCGKCMVQMAIGEEEQRSVLACTTVIKNDATITIPESTGHSTAEIVADSSIEHIDTTSEIFLPLCRTIKVKVPSPVAGVNHSDLQRMEKAVGAYIDNGRLGCSRKIMQHIAESLRQEEGLVTAVITEAGTQYELSAITAGNVPPHSFGIACDIGTTTIAMHLINCENGEIVASASDYNAQLSRGADIISRIDYARTLDRLEELTDQVLDTINNMISKLIYSAGITEENVYSMVIAGNCTMTHLFLGLPPGYIREDPYVPTVNHVPILSASDCSLLINPEALIQFAPGVGSYVGGDITAGLLCTEMTTTKNTISLFIDIGTNGEIVIGNGEFLLTCACSAGPAFEGSGIRCGRRADTGAIDSFTIDPKDRSINYTVIGNGLPCGICGSGLISLLGELLAAGFIDRSGKIDDTADRSRAITIDGTPGLVLVEAEFTKHKNSIVITEADIDNLIRTKGAIYAACDLLLKNAGLDISSIERVYIAGGFGKYIDIEAAIRIGLFPDIGRNKFTFLGNTALAGATRVLLSKKYRELLDELPSRMTYIDLSREEGYMDAYTAALFLPHTEMERFPSV